jgi:acetyl esterase/lipase
LIILAIDLKIKLNMAIHRFVQFILFLIPTPLALFSVGDLISNSTEEVSKVFYKPTYEVNVQRDLIYGYGLSHDSFNLENPKQIPLKLDVYIPENDFSNRPIMLLIHGGGFRAGSKEKPPFIAMSNFFAARGWVVFNINYRLLGDFGSLPATWGAYVDKKTIPSKRRQNKAVYPALRDAKAALRWVIAHKKEYGVNTDYITVGGGSAGAYSAISVGITENEDYRDELTVEEDPTLLSTNLNEVFEVKTILNFWGGKECVDAINVLKNKKLYNENNPSLFTAHGTNDLIVTYEKAEALEKIYDATGVPHVLYALEGKGHGPWNYSQNGNSLGDLALKFIAAQQQLEVL